MTNNIQLEPKYFSQPNLLQTQNITFDTFSSFVLETETTWDWLSMMGRVRRSLSHWLPNTGMSRRWFHIETHSTTPVIMWYYQITFQRVSVLLLWAGVKRLLLAPYRGAGSNKEIQKKEVQYEEKWWTDVSLVSWLIIIFVFFVRYVWSPQLS